MDLGNAGPWAHLEGTSASQARANVFRYYDSAAAEDEKCLAAGTMVLGLFNPLGEIGDGAAAAEEAFELSGAAVKGGSTESTRVFYRGTGGYDVEETVSNQAVNADRIASNQYGRDLELGEGLCLTSEQSTAQDFAELSYGKGNGGGPAVLQMTLPESAWQQLVAEHGAIEGAPIEGMTGTQALVPPSGIDYFNSVTTFQEIPLQ